MSKALHQESISTWLVSDSLPPSAAFPLYQGEIGRIDSGGALSPLKRGMAAKRQGRSQALKSALCAKP